MGDQQMYMDCFICELYFSFSFIVLYWLVCVRERGRMRAVDLSSLQIAINLPNLLYSLDRCYS